MEIHVGDIPDDELRIILNKRWGLYKCVCGTTKIFCTS
jgi:hypothetical protein